MNVGWFEDNWLINEHGSGEAVLSWIFTVNAAGELSVQDAVVESTQTSGAAAELVTPVATNRSQLGGSGAMVTMSPVIRSAESSSYGGNVGVNASASGDGVGGGAGAGVS